MFPISNRLLEEMASRLSDEDRDEMAIPSLLHPNPLLRWMAWRRLEAMAALVKASCPRDARVMDFGCGTGVLFHVLGERASRVFGVDRVTSAAELLVERHALGSVTLLKPEKAMEEIEPESLDVIVAAEVLEHIDPLDEVLAFFRTILKSEGRLLVSLPTENRLYRLGRRLAGFHGHYHRQNADSVARDIKKAGFRHRSGKSIPGPGPFAIYRISEFMLE